MHLDLEQDLLRGIDDPGVVTKLEHSEHRGEYAVRQKERQALKGSWIIWMAIKKLWKKDEKQIEKNQTFLESKYFHFKRAKPHFSLCGHDHHKWHDDDDDDDDDDGENLL